MTNEGLLRFYDSDLVEGFDQMPISYAAFKITRADFVLAHKIVISLLYNEKLDIDFAMKRKPSFYSPRPLRSPITGSSCRLSLLGSPPSLSPYRVYGNVSQRVPSGTSASLRRCGR